MAHNHAHHTETKNIKAAFFLNLVFTVIEFIGGYFTNSLAIMSDALHDLGDTMVLGLSWYFQKLSGRGATKKFSFGYKRFSLLGALIAGLVLLVGSIIIIYNAVPRLMNPEQPDAFGMMWLAILGVIVNGAAMLKLRKGTSINEKVVSLHMLEDVLGWVAVLIGSLIMQFYDVPILDPILSLLIAFYVLINVFKNLKTSLHIFLQGTPAEISISEINKSVTQLSGVKGVHDCHVWTLDGEYNLCSLHVVVENGDTTLEETEEIKKNIRRLLHDKFKLEHITLELETETANCGYIDNC